MAERKPREQVFWNRGCGRAFESHGFWRHRRDCLFRAMAWPLVIIFPAAAA